MTHAAAEGVVPEGPRKWCDPPRAFGKLGQTKRVWHPPDGHDPVEVAQFRAAVMQNAICVHVREFKNTPPLVLQRHLAALDGRAEASNHWNARLNGRINLTTLDIATLIAVLPGALPSEDEMKVFLDVAEGEQPPEDWRWPDTSAVAPASF